METKWNNIYIQDKNGKHFNNTASELSTAGVIRELNNHLKRAREFPQFYAFLDVDTAEIFINGDVCKCERSKKL